MTHNSQDLWLNDFPKPDAEAHKYTRGQAVILGSEDMVGASVMAATACARMGAGIVRVLVDSDDLKRHYQTILPSHIIATTDEGVLTHHATLAILAGCGVAKPSDRLLYLLKNKPAGKTLVLDGGALGAVADQGCYEVLSGSVITPHEGEYQRLFGEVSKTQEQLSNDLNCIIVRKGHETFMTFPNEGVICNAHSSPWLATAGTGDVLAGMIAGVLAQGMEKRVACAAATYIHGEAGIRLGAGMVATDIVKVLPQILKKMLNL